MLKVLVAVAQSQKHAKMAAKWRGPFQIINVVSNSLLEVRSLVTLKVNVVHTTRVRFYAEQHRHSEVELVESAQASDQAIYEVEDLLSCRIGEATQQLEVLCVWRGFPEEEATWEPAVMLSEDIPQMYAGFVESQKGHSELYEALKEFM